MLRQAEVALGLGTTGHVLLPKLFLKAFSHAVLGEGLVMELHMVGDLRPYLLAFVFEQHLNSGRLLIIRYKAPADLAFILF